MSKELSTGLVLEKKVESVIVRVFAQPGESSEGVYERLNAICKDIELLEIENKIRNQVENTVTGFNRHFNLGDDDSLTNTGITSDYHRVVISLLRNYDRCMGATEVAEEWGGINTGGVSRVFRASRKSMEKYKGHFEKCEGGGYRFTREGLKYVLDCGVPQILGENVDSDSG